MDEYERGRYVVPVRRRTPAEGGMLTVGEVVELQAQVQRLRAVARQAQAWLACGEDEQAEKRALDRLSWVVDALQAGDVDEA